MIVVQKPEPSRHVEVAAPGRQRLRDGNHVSVAVRDGEGGRPAPYPLASPEVVLLILPEAGRARRVDPREQFRRVSGVEVGPELDGPVRGIRDPADAVARLPRFDQVMQVVGVGRVTRAVSGLVPIEDLQCLDERGAGRDRRRRRVHDVTAIPARQRARARSRGTARGPRRSGSRHWPPCRPRSASRSRRDRTSSCRPRSHAASRRSRG